MFKDDLEKLLTVTEKYLEITIKRNEIVKQSRKLQDECLVSRFKAEEELVILGGKRPKFNQEEEKIFKKILDNTWRARQNY